MNFFFMQAQDDCAFVMGLFEVVIWDSGYRQPRCYSDLKIIEASCLITRAFYQDACGQ